MTTSSPTLGPQQKRVYDALADGGVLSVAQLAKLLGELKRTVANALYNLKQKDLVARSGHSWARTSTPLPAPKTVTKSSPALTPPKGAKMDQRRIPAGVLPPPHTVGVRSVFELGDRCRLGR